MQDERGPGLDFSFVFCVWQSSVRGCRFTFVFIYVIKVFEYSPVPASFFPFYELRYNFFKFKGDVYNFFHVKNAFSNQ